MAVKSLEDVVRDMSLSLETSIAEMSRKMAAESAKTDLALQKLSEESKRTDLALQNMSERMAAESAKTDLALQKLSEESAKTERVVRDLSLSLGNMGNKIGSLVELIVVPCIRKEMNDLGHNFRYLSANKVVKGPKARLAEVDLFLHNGAEAMAVEIKTTLSVEDVTKHIDRLKTMRDHEDAADIKHKTLYGAIAGIVVDDNAKKLALKKGLYVVEILEYRQRLNVQKPARKGKW